MFFLASKTIGVLLIPSNFISLVGVVGLILFRTRYASIGRKLVCACVAAYVICGFSPLGNLLLVPLETRFRHGMREGRTGRHDRSWRGD
jgi:hypothetical protein